MKQLLTALVIGITLSSAAQAGKMVKNNEQLEDVVHGYGQVSGSAAQAPVPEGGFANQGQREDQLHGYGEVKATKSEPATVRVGRTNNEQKEDQVYGYSN